MHGMFEALKRRNGAIGVFFNYFQLMNLLVCERNFIIGKNVFEFID